ncbi:MFS transporter [Saccharomonospora sp. NPDC046836]|uniref:MFS transporter n=1 Tax=Saccharomonospora sp. NPDC046836 TaxID=3156921 RepID=UPI0033D90CE3
MADGDGPGARRIRSDLAGSAITALALRAPVVAVAPVLGDVRADLGLTGWQVSLLVTIPVLCFGAFAFVASLSVARWGPHTTLVQSFVVVLAGLVVRVLGSGTAALAGTFLLGVAIAVANVVLPIVASTHSERAGSALTTSYVTAMNIGSLAATLATAPLAAVSSWQVAITLPYLLVTMTALGWALWRRGPAGSDREVPSAPGRRLRTDRAAWLLLLAFSGQTLAYYGTTSWLPTMLRDELALTTASAGGAASLFQLAGVLGPLLALPLSRRLSLRACFALAACAWMVFPAGFVLAPGLWWVWTLVAGAGHGAAFAAVLLAVVRIGGSGGYARRVSAFVQGGGYAVGSAGPVLLGFALGVSGSWTAPLLIVGAAAVVLGVAGVSSTSIRRPVPPLERAPDVVR